MRWYILPIDVRLWRPCFKVKVLHKWKLRFKQKSAIFRIFTQHLCHWIHSSRTKMCPFQFFNMIVLRICTMQKTRTHRNGNRQKETDNERERVNRWWKTTNGQRETIGPMQIIRWNTQTCQWTVCEVEGGQLWWVKWANFEMCSVFGRGRGWMFFLPLLGLTHNVTIVYVHLLTGWAQT